MNEHQYRIRTRRGNYDDIPLVKTGEVLTKLARKRSIAPGSVLADLEYMANYAYPYGVQWPARNPVHKALEKIRGIKDPHNMMMVEWADHQDVDKSDGRTIYVCHPYHLSAESMAEIVQLKDHGLEVFISGLSPYNIGAMRMTIEKVKP